MKIKNIVLAILFTCTIFEFQEAAAYNFPREITEIEYLSSTPMCQRSLRIWNGIYRGPLPFVPSITREESEKPQNWNSGDNIIWKHGGWHYCGGVIRISRAERNIMPLDERDELVKRGLRDCHFSWSTIPKTEPWAAAIGTTIARGHLVLGERDKALEYIKLVLANHPKYEDAYSVGGMSFYKQGEYDDAREWFQKAIDVSGGRSGQATYFLGLTELKAGNLDEAKAHAAKAEQLGYPLPGLKNLIAKAEAEM